MNRMLSAKDEEAGVDGQEQTTRAGEGQAPQYSSPLRARVEARLAAVAAAYSSGASNNNQSSRSE